MEAECELHTCLRDKNTKIQRLAYEAPKYVASQANNVWLVPRSPLSEWGSSQLALVV